MEFVFLGRGWGHGVGLCQNGAFGMALAGATYDAILRHYYTGHRHRRRRQRHGGPAVDAVAVARGEQPARSGYRRRSAARISR